MSRRTVTGALVLGAAAWVAIVIGTPTGTNSPTAPGRAVLGSKLVYASHYFQSGLDLLAVLPANGGFYLMDFYRLRIDPPTGIAF